MEHVVCFGTGWKRELCGEGGRQRRRLFAWFGVARVGTVRRFAPGFEVRETLFAWWLNDAADFDGLIRCGIDPDRAAKVSFAHAIRIRLDCGLDAQDVNAFAIESLCAAICETVLCGLGDIDAE